MYCLSRLWGSAECGVENANGKNCSVPDCIKVKLVQLSAKVAYKYFDRNLNNRELWVKKLAVAIGIPFHLYHFIYTEQF